MTLLNSYLTAQKKEDGSDTIYTALLYGLVRLNIINTYHMNSSDCIDSELLLPPAGVCLDRAEEEEGGEGSQRYNRASCPVPGWKMCLRVGFYRQ